jgi:2-oxoglutarate dehydrogenase E2 component (dihydrolipoamide succinyltransferase)
MASKYACQPWAKRDRGDRGHWFKGLATRSRPTRCCVELETDKVTVEVPAPAAGMLGEIVAAEGATVGVDALLATLREGQGRRRRQAQGDRAQRPGQGGARGREAGGESVDVMVPTLGESVTEATVATWFKSVGDTVAQDEMLCELETDKVSVEVPAPASGTLTEILPTKAAPGRRRAASSPRAAPPPWRATRHPPKPRPRRSRRDVARQGGGPGKDPEDAPSAARKAMAEAGLTRDRVRAPAATAAS